MTNERFWKSFWILFVGTTFLCIAASASLFFSYVGKIDAAAIGIDYSSDKDPFENGLHQSPAAQTVTGGSLYKDRLPLGLTSWTWSAVVDFRANSETVEGGSAIKVIFSQPWGGLGIGAFKVNTSANKTLTFSVSPDAAVGDLYVQLYDAEGTPLPMQSVGWYAPGGALAANQWQVVSIPVQNLLGSSTSATVSAVSITGTNPGTAYIDSVEFTGTPSAHALWVYKAPEGYVEPPFNPFATSTPQALPYTLLNSPTADDRWYSPRGLLEQDYSGFVIGPQKGVGNDALGYFRSGKSWSDYQVTATVKWGGTQVFALIARMQDENNYVSCSFSNQADTIQMYNVVDGITHEVAESDKIHYSDYIGGTGNIGIIVHGDTLVCSSGGKRVLSRDVKGMPMQGTVGMEAWDQNDSATPDQVQAFKVQALVGE